MKLRTEEGPRGAGDMVGTESAEVGPTLRIRCPEHLGEREDFMAGGWDVGTNLSKECCQ